MADIVRLPVPGWSNYFASADGFIWTRRNKNGKGFGAWRIMSGRACGKMKYSRVYLQESGRIEECYVHHLVLLAFVGPRPDGMEAIHKNDMQSDNRAENLKWGTHIENCALRRTNGKDDKRRVLNDEAVKWIRANRGKVTYREMAKILKVSRSAVISAGTGVTWKHVKDLPDDCSG